jgi:hypothetical protein
VELGGLSRTKLGNSAAVNIRSAIRSARWAHGLAISRGEGRNRLEALGRYLERRQLGRREQRDGSRGGVRRMIIIQYET